MSSFEQASRGNSQFEDADMASQPPLKSDTEIINECMQRHQTFYNVMQNRLEQNTTVLKYIVQQNDMGAALNALAMIKDSTVTMDILNSTFVKNKRMDMLNY